jgi:hypothetical protein
LVVGSSAQMKWLNFRIVALRNPLSAMPIMPLSSNSLPAP